jgi:xylulokinase
LPGLPPVLASSATRPLLPATAARLGCGQIPVCVGAADSVLGALGLGVSAPGQIAYVAGTSTVILGVSDRLVLDPAHRFLVTPLAEPGNWGLEMDLLTTGSAMRWLAGLLGGGLDEAALVDLAASADPADAPVVLPYLSPGEQGALWDPLLHGAVAGLTLGHGRPDLARGLVNGIVLESRRCLSVLDETGPFGQELRVTGGSAAQASFRADLADGTGRRVVRTGGEDGSDSALGAALLASRSVGQTVSVVRSGGQPPGAVAHEPDPGRAALWHDLWVRYEQARNAVTGYYHSAE